MLQQKQSELPPDRPYYSPQLLAARHEGGLRRAAAMCADYDVVAGMKLSPITPASYSRLIATASPFLRPQANATRADVRNYVWLHSPRFTLEGRAKTAVVRELEWRIAPPWRRWRFSRHAWHTFTAAGWAVAMATIAELVEVTFADRPPPSNRGGTVGASLEAQLIDLFAREYHEWPFATAISDTPLRKLYQLLRCINGVDYDAEEAAIISADLARENQDAIAASN